MTQDPAERLAALRAEVTSLETELGARRRGGWWRPLVTGICLVVLALAAPLAVVATWAHDQVGDTDRYVETVAPLADDPAVQAAVAARLTGEITSRIDVRAVTDQAIDALTAQGLPPAAAVGLKALGGPLANGVESFVAERVDGLVRSDEFADAWATANRQAHDQMVTLLTGADGEAVQVEGNAVRLNLAVLIDAVRARLVDAGFTLVERLPTISAEFTLFQSADLARAQSAFRLLDALARVLPIVALLALAGAVLAARDRRRGLVVAALVVCGSMLVLGLALNGFRVLYLDRVPPDQLPTDAAAAVYDTLVRFIRYNLRALLVLFLAVAAVAWLAGPAAAGVRRAAARGLDSTRRGADRAGLDTGPVGAFLGRNRGLVRALVGGAVVLVYVMAEHPTGGWTLSVLVVAGAVLLVAELLARPAA